MEHLLILRGAMGAGKSAVAVVLRQRRPRLKIVEVDDIKLERYGTTEKCCPSKDFPYAGKLAKSALDKGFTAVIVEPLVELTHLQLVLDTTGKTEDSANVSFVWLDCSIRTAMERKSGSFQESVIEGQFQRYTNRYRPKRERIISTDDLSVEQIAEEILEMLPS